MMDWHRTKWTWSILGNYFKFRRRPTPIDRDRDNDDGNDNDNDNESDDDNDTDDDTDTYDYHNDNDNDDYHCKSYYLRPEMLLPPARIPRSSSAPICQTSPASQPLEIERYRQHARRLYSAVVRFIPTA